MRTPSKNTPAGRLIAVDALLRRDYCSDDLDLAVAAAVESGDQTLLAFATLSPEQRESKRVTWCGRAFAELVAADDELRRNLGYLCPELANRVHAGEVPLGEISAAAWNARREVEAKSSDRRRTLRTHLQAAMVSLSFNPVSVRPNSFPAGLVVLADGSLKLHVSYQDAKTHGRGSGLPWAWLAFNRPACRWMDIDPADEAASVAAIERLACKLPVGADPEETVAELKLRISELEEQLAQAAGAAATGAAATGAAATGEAPAGEAPTGEAPTGEARGKRR